MKLLPPAGMLLAIVCGLGARTNVEGATAEFRRDLSTDRPDATESPFTVEAGRWQVEFEAARWMRDSEDGVRVEAWTLGATNIKYGLNDRADLQLVIEPYTRLRVRTAGGRETHDGVGDTVVRLKANFTGNDAGGEFAAAIMPFVKLPTASRGLGNDHVEGGFIFPFAFTLPQEWSAGAMAEFDWVRNEDDSGYELAVVTTATVSRALGANAAFFLELANEARDGRASSWALSFNTGLTFALSENAQLDAGVNLGLSDPAIDRAVFVGFSTRW